MSWFKRRKNVPDTRGEVQLEQDDASDEGSEQVWNSRVEEANALARLDEAAGGDLTPQEAERLADETRRAIDANPADQWPDFDVSTYTIHNAAVTRAGRVNGKHYTEWPDEIRQMKRDGRVAEALELLLGCIVAAERSRDGREPAPWYTEQAAIIYRQQKEYLAEIAIIERWQAACPSDRRGPGKTQDKLASRLVKARALLANSSTGDGS
jgi:hypothetical protein